MANFYSDLQKSDWLGRNPEDYTYNKKGLSIGWEKTLLKDEPLSRFILKVSSKNLTADRAILLTKQACNNILSRMNVRKVPARITFTNEFVSWQKEQTICVTLEPLNGKINFPTFNHRLDPILGYCVHEIAHLLYTDAEYDRYVNKFKGAEAKLKRMIMNTLEDERIEQKVANTFRGYTGYIGKAKDYAFGKKLIDEMSNGKVDMASEINQLVNTFIHLVRYPKALDEGLVNKFEPELKQIVSILENYPSDIQELTVATDKIYNVFKEFYDDQQGDDDSDSQAQTDDSQSSKSSKSLKQKQKKQNKQQKSNDDPEQGQDKNEGTNEPKNDKNDSKDTDKTDDQTDTDDDKEENGNDKEQGSDGEDESEDDDSNTSENDEYSDGEDGDNDTDDDGKEETDGDKGMGGEPKPSMDDALNSMLEALSSIETEPGDANQVAKELGGDYRVAQVLEEISKYSNDDVTQRQGFAHTFPHTENLNSSELSVVWFEADKLQSTSNNYDRGLAEVRTYASSLRAKIQQLNRNQTIVNTGLFEGDFDEHLLVDAIIGVKNIYKQENKVFNQGACVGLLIDESGSMGGRKWYEAMKIAILFERALEGVNNVDFYCYGHTTGSSLKKGSYYNTDATWINVYYEGRKKSNRRNLGKIHSHNTNRDGHAILEVIGRMRTKVPAEVPIILFMISDGEPSASVPQPYTGRTYTKKAVDTVEKFANSTVIHIAIERGIPSSEMFNTYVEFTDHSRLVNDIGRLLKKIMTKQQTAVVI